jgi:hypothetical protein
MLTLWDDYPLHQLPEPVAVLNSADPAQYERYRWSAWSMVPSAWCVATIRNRSSPARR